MLYQNKEILFWAHEFFNTENIQPRLKEKVKKFYEFEFYFTTENSELIPAKNIIRIYPTKGKVFWKILFKVKPGKQFDLSDYSIDRLSVYPIDWIKDENSENFIGGLRRCIYTCFYDTVFKDFMKQTLERYKKQARSIFKQNVLIKHR